MTLTLRQEKMKQREGDRLKRSLRLLFGGKNFGFLWTDDSTSYTDGKTIWVKYDIQTPNHRDFSPEECRILRKAHGFHERGHIEFDFLEDYTKWLKENSSTSLNDWRNTMTPKYPIRWLQYFGNMSLDGRMENLSVKKFPNFKDYVDFCNYEWRFGIRGAGIGQDPVVDFQDCYASRVLGMKDLEGWLPESKELVDSVQGQINKLRIAPSTSECLCIVSDIMITVWPTLINWMVLNNEIPENPPAQYHSDAHDEHQQWGDAQETQDNSQKVLVLIDNSAGSDSAQDEQENKETYGDDDQPPDFSSLLKSEKRQMEKDVEDINNDAMDFDERNEMVSIEIPSLKKTNREEVIIKPYPRRDIQRFNTTHREVSRFIKPAARVFRQLLEGEVDTLRKNVRSGRFRPNQAWKAIHCQNNNVFQKKYKGTPKDNAFISFMMDISGSTGLGLPSGTLVIDEMKKALQLLLEACIEADVPSNAYAFTEIEDGSIIYPIKSHPERFSDDEKSCLGGIREEYSNRDTLALQWAINQISAKEENIRILIMLSDGIPIFGPDEDPFTIRNMVEKAEKSGIDVLCLFVGQPKQEIMDVVKSMYPGRAIFAEQNISKELQKQVKRIIRQRRK
ncbi:hypothetical protein [Bacillus infantis]|uniref:hypothetical protein n=1 Tax=Bacillus infantis TaxID=324767 RepID=UPI00209DA102|nr:hypothetical protein [Bacillus infantis]MCP1161410.1 hypothetical protein [Bacillus infantis]